MDLSRKAFVGVAATAIGLTAFGGAAKVLGGNEELLRPPVVLDEAAFISKCVRCYRCISACHTGALVPATLDDGLLEIKTPKFDFRQGSCDFCNECVKVCPTHAIDVCDPLNPEQGRIGIAVVIPERCVAYYNGCVVCKDACPYEAISVNESGHPVVDESRCNGCGICENVCPALVYRSFSGGNQRGITVVKNSDSAVLTSQATDEEISHA